uniref:BHLH domain-containing protein n=1 Tax=Scophthalmus maximus TaxID=52904 RepID=A0A8D3DYD7_SCOMX
MAPTITAQEHLTLSHKVRKPLVEKLRRERINSSIEQLKCLLAPELVQQQPDSKLEKADVLEMTKFVSSIDLSFVKTAAPLISVIVTYHHQTCFIPE